MAGSEIVNYGDTICVVGGFDEATKLPRKSVSCWNPLQIGADANNDDDDEGGDDVDDARNSTLSKGDLKRVVLNNFWHFSMIIFLSSGLLQK